MNKLNYLDKDVRKKYLILINNEKYIDLIIEQIMNEYRNVMILDILNNERGIEVIVKADDENITLTVDYIKYETYLACPNWEHITIYSNVIKKNYVPIGKEYHKNNNVVLKYHSRDVYPHRFLYTGLGNDYFQYEININTTGDNDVDDIVITKALLNNNKPITRIKDLLELMNNTIDLSKYEVKIQNKDDYISTIIVSFGILTKYVEYLEKDDMDIKIYLEDGQFYQDITESKKIDNDFIPFVKKKGEKHG